MLWKSTASIRQQVRQRASVLDPMPRAVPTSQVRSSHHQRCGRFRSRGGGRPGIAAARSNILLPALDVWLVQASFAVPHSSRVEYRLACRLVSCEMISITRKQCITLRAIASPASFTFTNFAGMAALWTGYLIFRA